VANQGLPGKVLFIDHDATVAQRLEAPLQKHGISLVKAGDQQTALYHFNQQRFEVIVVEMEMNDLPGIALIQKFRAHANRERREAAIILSIGQKRKGGDDHLLAELGNIETIDKPLSEIKLLPYFQRAIARRSLNVEMEDAREIAYNSFKTHRSAETMIKDLSGKLQNHEKERLGIVADVLEDNIQYAEAERIVDGLLAKNPEDLRFINAKGRLLLKTGKADQAKVFLEKADKLAPDNLERIEAMAKMYLETADPDAAVEKMKRMIALNPEDPELRFTLFEDLEKAGYQDHAIGLCRATTEPKEVVRYYNNKGVALARDNQAEKALKDYYVALIYYPKFKDNYRILYNIAIAEAKKRTPAGKEAAIKALHKCIALAPEFDKSKKLLEQLEGPKKAVS